MKNIFQLYILPTPGLLKKEKKKCRKKRETSQPSNETRFPLFERVLNFLIAYSIGRTMLPWTIEIVNPGKWEGEGSLKDDREEPGREEQEELPHLLIGRTYNK